ncbi:hypothetical protein JCM10207_004899 [Rhodosporidiobolus poonsookiae]
MAPYSNLAVNASDAELGLPASKEHTPSIRPRGTASGAFQTTAEQRKKVGWVAVGALVVIVVLVKLSGGGSREKREVWGPPSKLSNGGGGAVPDASTLLTSAAPATSYFDALRPDLRYLTADSWSGLTGQYLSALSLLYLAHRTQRVAILPSWRDWDHYGDSMVTIGQLFDMDKFRQSTGALFVDWDEVKPLDRKHKKTKRDPIGCYMGPNSFEYGRSFDEHNLDETIWRVDRPGGWFQHSIEGFTLFDFDEADRLRRTKEFAEREQRDIPPNMLDSHLICYSNLWDLNHAGAHATGWSWDEGFRGQQKQEGSEKEMLSLSARGTHPEWWALGQYMDFQPDIWDIAISAVKRTLKTSFIPKNLITMHLRRGDFKTWCSSGAECTPTLDAYAEKLKPLLAISPSGTRVLVTTDEQDDSSFLSSIDALGWSRINHRALGTPTLLARQYGDAARWADAVVDQAILALGMHFVGTSGSQVSLVTELRVAAWNGGETRLVQRPS